MNCRMLDILGVAGLLSVPAPISVLSVGESVPVPVDCVSVSAASVVTDLSSGLSVSVLSAVS